MGIVFFSTEALSFRLWFNTVDCLLGKFHCGMSSEYKTELISILSENRQRWRLSDIILSSRRKQSVGREAVSKREEAHARVFKSKSQ